MSYKFPPLAILLARAAALLLLAGYLTVVTGSYRAASHPSSFSFGVQPCGEAVCISSIVPGGLEWFFGVRRGMILLSVNGRTVRPAELETLSASPITSADVQTLEGKTIRIRVTEDPTGRSPMRESLWIVGALFALLGAIVIVRRPDLATARLFWLFAGSAAVGLATTPGAAGAGIWWARILQAPTLVGTGSSFVPLALALGRENGRAPDLRVTAGWGALGLALLAGYAVSLYAGPSVYQLIRPAVMLYLAAALIVGVVALALAAARRGDALRKQQLRIVLWGVALGTAPFVCLSLIPNVLGAGTLLPLYVAILPLGLVPIAFAYATLQYRMMGIRRLVHRGMVYGTATVLLLSLLGVAVSLLVHIWTGAPRGMDSQGVVMALVAAGILLFFPLRALARRLVDKLAYGGAADYRAVISVLGRDLWTTDARAQASAIVHHLAQMLQLESGLLVLDRLPDHGGLVARSGERSDDVWTRVHPQLVNHIERLRDQDIAEVRWQSEVFLVANLFAERKHLGYLLLGPKRGGEVFVQEERELIATVMPLLALAIDKSELSQELRELNWRLVKAQETERARIAGDLHDGPLQKVILLVGTAGKDGAERRELARQAVSEIREICTRLRPSILDDLGLVPAIEWLTGQVSRQSGLSISLALHHVSEDDRFDRDVEVALFRVAQESMNNAVKHSKGASVQVRLSRERDELILRVEDDGIGFSDAQPTGLGFGLSGMRERMAQVKGSLDVQSAPGMGTRVVARVPVSSEVPQQAHTQ